MMLRCRSRLIIYLVGQVCLSSAVKWCDQSFLMDWTWMRLQTITTMAAKFTKVPISALPLPPPSHILPHNLTPDPNEPTPSDFIHDVLRNRPSVQRRARLLPAEAHFAYVSPMPLEFPYHVPPIPASGIDDTAAYIESWLKEREATVPAETALAQNGPARPNGLTKFVSQARDQKRVLVGLAETCLRDCLPHLDVGDAFSALGRPALVPSSSETEEEVARAGKEEDEEASDVSPAARVRQELVDVLGGHAVLMSADVAADSKGYAPWSLRYSGHQFGSWAGQLGDGRAISIRKCFMVGDCRLVDFWDSVYASPIYGGCDV